MTCIVGIVEDNVTYLGCDSYVGDGSTYQLLPATEHKLFSIPLKRIGAPADSILFGFAGNIRSCQIIKHNLVAPVLDIDAYNSPIKYIINELIPSIKGIHHAHGDMRTTEGREHSDSAFIVGLDHTLYKIYMDYGVIPVDATYTAIGSGCNHAMGSLQSTEGKLPRERITLALDAAASHTNFVRAPFYIEQSA